MVPENGFQNHLQGRVREAYPPSTWLLVLPLHCTAGDKELPRSWGNPMLLIHRACNGYEGTGRGLYGYHWVI